MTVADITLHGWMLRRCELSADRAAISYAGDTWTYRDLRDRIVACAHQLNALGVGPGTRVAYLDFNSANFFTVLFAASQLGAIFVPVNFRLTAAEIEHVLDDATPAVMYAGSGHLDLTAPLRERYPDVTFVQAERAGVSEHEQKWGTDDLPRPPVDPTDVAVVMYTSGTTGRPKGAMLTHANLWWNNVNGRNAFDVLADDVTLLVMPIFHIGALNTLGLSTLEKGGRLVVERAFAAAETLDVLITQRVTTMMGVPTAFQAMADLPAFDDADLGSLRLLIAGGSPIPVPLLERYASRGLMMVQGWGMTEAAPVVTFLTSEFGVDKVGSAGRPVMFCEVRLADPDGATVSEAGVRGEAYVRGPNVMKGYWNRPADTEAVLSKDGWFRTGDIAYRDEDGFFYIVDRAKDMIISGGENIYPAEIEGVLRSHPGIADVAVVGTPDARWGESVVAVVAPAPGQDVSLSEIREWAGSFLARYKLPKSLVVVEDLPRSATGKLLKPEIRAMCQRHLSAEAGSERVRGAVS